MVAWPQEDYEHRTIGDFVQDFEDLAQEENPFPYPIRYLKAR